MKRRSFLKWSAFGGVSALVAGYPLLIERQWLRVNRYTVPIDGLPPAFDHYSIAQVTDIHLGFLVSEAFVQGVVETANALKPDLIACTGDYVHEQNSRRDIDRVWPLLSRLQARDGVASVLGNHDHWADSERSLYWLERSGQNLRHRCRTIERDRDRLVIAGTGDLWEDTLRIDRSFASSDPGDCRILLAHNPDTMDTRFSTPLSLVLSGHTHGGQVSIPGIGPPFLPVVNKRYSRGLITTDNGPLFISSGIGWSVLPLRFNCGPEIALLELVNSGRPSRSATS